jgi:hypothetical protein
MALRQNDAPNVSGRKTAVLRLGQRVEASPYVALLPIGKNISGQAFYKILSQ